MSGLEIVAPGAPGGLPAALDVDSCMDHIRRVIEGIRAMRDPAALADAAKKAELLAHALKEVKGAEQVARGAQRAKIEALIGIGILAGEPAAKGGRGHKESVFGEETSAPIDRRRVHLYRQLAAHREYLDAYIASCSGDDDEVSIRGFLKYAKDASARYETDENGGASGSIDCTKDATPAAPSPPAGASTLPGSPAPSAGPPAASQRVPVPPPAPPPRPCADPEVRDATRNIEILAQQLKTLISDSQQGLDDDPVLQEGLELARQLADDSRSVAYDLRRRAEDPKRDAPKWVGFAYPKRAWNPELPLPAFPPPDSSRSDLTS